MKRLLVTAAFSAALLGAAPAPAAEPAAKSQQRSSAEAELRRARDHFEYGAYEKAREIAERLLAENVLALDEQLIDANRIAGLAHFYSTRPDRLAKAERYFLQLLSVEPEYRLDPFFTPPAAVQFYDEVRQANESRLAPIRAQRKRAKEARRAEQEARKRFLAEARSATDAEAAVTRVVERHNLALVFLPLGAGQFQNGETSKGILLAKVQVVAGLTSVISYVAIENLGDDGGYRGRELEVAQTLDVVKWASAGLFYAAWGYGVGDAWMAYRAEVPVAGPPTPEPGPSLPLPQVQVGADGASLGLSLQF